MVMTMNKFDNVIFFLGNNFYFSTSNTLIRCRRHVSLDRNRIHTKRTVFIPNKPLLIVSKLGTILNFSFESNSGDILVKTYVIYTFILMFSS